MRNVNGRLQVGVALLVTLSLITAGCPGTGGGGGGGGGNRNQNAPPANGNLNRNAGGTNQNQNAPPGNRAPTADAGSDQSVMADDPVTLNGTGSTDPDGDTLTFSWRQTAGTNVTLSNANSAQATFTAPNVTETLTFELTVDDGNGGTDTDMVSVAVTARAIFLFATSNSEIVSYRDPGGFDGRVTANTVLESGGSNDFFQPRDIAIDADGALYIASQGDDSITIFENATSATGTLLPARKLTGAATQIGAPLAVAIDTQNNVLFVANGDSLVDDDILVFDNAPELDGDLAPARTFFTGVNIDPLQLAFAGGALYVVNQTVNTAQILVFDDASTLTGQVSASRTITSGLFGSLLTIHVGVDNRLYAVDAEEQVFIWNGASTVTGGQMPNVILTVDGADTLMAVAVDSDDRLYIADRGSSFIHVFDNAASLMTGIQAPDRQFDDLELNAPMRLLILEP